MWPPSGYRVSEGMWALQYDLRNSIRSDRQCFLLVKLFTWGGEGTMNWVPGNPFVDGADALTACVTPLFFYLASNSSARFKRVLLDHLLCSSCISLPRLLE